MSYEISSEDRAGQGDLPPVPVETRKCPTCSKLFELSHGMLPYKCEHCGYILRPANDTLISNLIFAFRSTFRISSRATRKEFWTADLFSSFLIIIGFFIQIHLFIGWVETDGIVNNYLFYLAAIAIATLLLYIFQWVLLVRRLHDINLTGWWVGLSVLLSVSLLLVYAFPLYVELSNIVLMLMDYHTILDEINFISEENTLMSPYSFTELCGWNISMAYFEVRLRNALYGFEYPFYFLAIRSAITFANTVLALILLCCCFVDSQKGCNPYGPSRKYPLA